MLGADDPFPSVGRVLINGASGAGKSMLGRRLSAATGIPYTELDALHHGAGWTPRPEFLDDVRALVASETWIADWQYPAARPLLLGRAEAIVWLDYSRAVILRRVVPRTVSRRLRRTELWNGNREGPLRHLFTDPEHIIRWAWSTAPDVAARMREVPVGLPVVRLRSPAEAERWIRARESETA